MATLDTADILKQLAGLAPSENPFTFLDDLLQESVRQPASVGITVVLCICAACWLVSLACSILGLRSKHKRGDRVLFRNQSSGMGTFSMRVYLVRCYAA
jgi:hypothetical protein